MLSNMVTCFQSPMTATKANQGGCKDLLKHISEFKCTRAEELYSHLADKTKMKNALNSYTDKLSSYVEFLMASWTTTRICQKGYLQQGV